VPSLPSRTSWTIEGSTGGDRKCLLTSQAGIKEPFQGFAGVVNKFLESRGGGNGNGRNDALRVPCCTSYAASKLAGCKVGDTAHDKVLDKLGESDEWERYRDRREIGDRRVRYGARQPRNYIEAVSIECGVFFHSGKGNKDVLGNGLQEWRDKRCINVIEVLELVKVNLVCALTTEGGEDGGLS